MYAIQNIWTGMYVYGTDYTCVPNRQKTSPDRMLTYDTLDNAKLDFYCRKCSNDYKIVELEEVKVRKIIPLSKEDIRKWVCS